MRLRIHTDDLELLAAVIAFLLYMAFLAAVGPFWFPIVITGSIERG